MSVKVDVIKCYVDLLLIPGATLFDDPKGQQWVMIPTPKVEDTDNGKYSLRNQARLWAGKTRDGQHEKRCLNLDVTPYIGQHPEWNYSHQVKIYKDNPDAPKNSRTDQDIIVGNGKMIQCNWENIRNEASARGRISYEGYKNKNYGNDGKDNNRY